jgi:hypothetical protein
MAPSRASKTGKKSLAKRQIEEEFEEEVEVSSPSVLDTAEGGNVNYDSDLQSESDGESSDVRTFSLSVPKTARLIDCRAQRK